MDKILKAKKENIRDIINIYDSANMLFEVNERAEGTEDIFNPLLEKDNTYIMYYKSHPIAFMSYHDYKHFTELTALYVKLEYQRCGIGDKLINYFENSINTENRVLIIKVLNNASWAINFYLKHRYNKLNDEIRIKLKLDSINLHPWSTTLFKIK